jgi:serine/threonine protein kinase
MTPECHPKIADFGLAKLIPTNALIQRTLAKGNEIYSPPEWHNPQRGDWSYGYPADVWALIFWELITLQSIWDTTKMDHFICDAPRLHQ